MNPAPLCRPVLLYDDSCRLCRFAARGVIRLDRLQRLAVLSLKDEAASPLLAALPARERLETWRLAQPDGRLHGYGAGMRELVEAMRSTHSAGPVLSRIPDGLLDAVYRVVARNRSLLGRLVPDGPAPHRYP